MHNGSPELFHRRGIVKHFSEIHHVVGPAGKGRGEHGIAPGQCADIVAVSVGDLPGFCRTVQIAVGRHPVCRNVLAGITVFDQGRAAAVVLVV